MCNWSLKADGVSLTSVCTTPGDRVPGPRAYALLSPVEFPWREAVDTVEEVGATDSYRLSMLLSREGLICGPSSGFNLQGLYNFLQKRKDAGTLPELAGEDGSIHCVFICCDLPYQYLDEYFSKLNSKSFHPITCEVRNTHGVGTPITLMTIMLMMLTNAESLECGFISL